MKTCPSCRLRIDYSCENCPSCGASQPKQPEVKKTTPSKFFLVVNKERQGPYSCSELLLRLKENTISVQTPCRKDGTNEWSTVADVLLEQETLRQHGDGSQPLPQLPARDEIYDTQRLGHSTKPHNLLTFFLPIGRIGRVAFAFRYCFLNCVIAALVGGILGWALALLLAWLMQEMDSPTVAVAIYAARYSPIILLHAWLSFVSAAKRAHDINEPTHYALWLIVPIASIVFMFIFLFKPGVYFHFEEDL